MEYKYLLELLKGGLYTEFFKEFHHCGVPFLQEEVYGRSTTQNVSFIVSSLNPVPSMHGRGFVARLSGSTTEFLQMYTLMFAGAAPFVYKEGELILSLQPAIPSYLIGKDAIVEATLAGNSRVRYHFADHRDYIPGEYTIRRMESTHSAAQIRNGIAALVEVWLT